MRLYLLGFMGSGKTTIGEQLSKALDYDFIDTDKTFTNKYGISIPEFFEKYGEPEFRAKETEILQSIENQSNTIISTGGGLPCHNENLEYINNTGQSLYIYLKINELCARLSESDIKKRPLLKDLDSPSKLKAFILKTLMERERHYFNSHLIVDGNQPVLEIVNDVKSYFSMN